LADPIFIKDKGDLLNVNPALIGCSGASRVNLEYRNQWNGTGNASSRFAFTYDRQVEQLHGGIGVGIEKLDYEKGMYSGYSAKLGYAPRFNISRVVSLSVAAAFVVNQLEVNFENYRYDSQVEFSKGDVYDTYEYGYVPRTDKIVYKDLSMGVMLNTPFCFIGGSAEHLTEPGQNLYTSDLGKENKLKRKYSVQIGTDYKKNSASKLAFSPQLIFENQGGKSELWASSSFRFNNLIAGTGISTNKSMKGILGIQGKNLRLMYSYDLTRSELLKQTKGSHEASLRVLFNSKKTKSPLAFL
jgi:type IX secretion system PorP/SprF family membrane protein